MSELKLHNSLSREIETFTKNKDEPVLMYNCGPTVYDVQHIGNLSAFVFADTIRKTLEYNGYSVKQVINITDVGHLSGDNQGDPNIGDDKMMRGLKENNLPVSLEGLKALSEKYTAIFLEDIEKLGLPVADIEFPRASDYIKEQIEMIQKLEEGGHVYTTSDGVYFDIATFPEYGALGNVKSQLGKEAQGRVGTNDEKRNKEDFALWKFNTDYGWESPWGKGFPGWHIECSAMATKLLGPQIDIHTGGIEHVSIHHNNEIAQSECANHAHPFSRFWVHRNHVQLDGGKISKSSGDVVYLSDILEQGFDPSDLRYFFLQAHYATPTNFTWEALKAASVARKKLATFLTGIVPGSVIEQYKEQFMEALNANLNTPKALSVLFTMLADESLSKEDRAATLLDFNKAFGLDFSTKADASAFSEDDIRRMEDRKLARVSKDFAESDRLRDELKSSGYSINDMADHTVYEKGGRDMTF